LKKKRDKVLDAFIFQSCSLQSSLSLNLSEYKLMIKKAAVKKNERFKALKQTRKIPV
jgi:hypothetical protein